MRKQCQRSGTDAKATATVAEKQGEPATPEAPCSTAKQVQSAASVAPATTTSMPSTSTLFFAAALWLVLPPGSTWEQPLDMELPQRITHMTLSPGQSFYLPSHTPSLRGCCGAPTDFQWVFLDSSLEATAGAPFRTRVFALDAFGRQARPSSCNALHIDLGLSGRARLSQETSPPSWGRRAVLQLDIESEVAGPVEADIRIESPVSTADVLLYSSQIQFISGPAHSFAISVRRAESAGLGMQGINASSTMWPLDTTLEVAVSARDRFGNRVELPGRGGLAAGLSPGQARVQSLAKRGLALRSSMTALKMEPQDGLLQISDEGEARVLIRSSEAGVAELWLELTPQAGASPKEQEELREWTVQAILFAETSAERPVLESRATDGNLSAVDANWQSVAVEVREAFLHAWRGYRNYAWGWDELQPLSKRGRNSFGGIGITILDSLTSLWLMGLDEQFREAAAWVRDELDFDKADSETSVFELIIRGVGGLLGAHALSGQSFFLEKARDLADRLLPALNTSSKLPLPKWNIARRRGNGSAEPTILAEAGSLQLEFRYLSSRTGDKRFRTAADRAFDAIRSTGASGLLPVYLTPPGFTPVRMLTSKFAVGALADSYYEYLLKQWLQSPSEDRFRRLWLEAMDELPALVRPRPSFQAGKPDFKVLEAAMNGDAIWKMDHLSCFAPAMIALGLHTLRPRDLAVRGRNATWWRLAEGLTSSCVQMWTSSRTGLAPEFSYVKSRPPFQFAEVPQQAAHSFLRPETAESLFYMYRFTGDERYRQWGEKIFRAIMEHAKVDAGFASVKDVNQKPTEKHDEMQSFVMAETLKYLWLLFSPADALDLDRFVLNTEGHPLPRQGFR